jgi:hypothetical protein
MRAKGLAAVPSYKDTENLKWREKMTAKRRDNTSYNQKTWQIQITVYYNIVKHH